MERRISVGAARQALQEVTADELLRESRTPLRQKEGRRTSSRNYPRDRPVWNLVLSDSAHSQPQ